MVEEKQQQDDWTTPQLAAAAGVSSARIRQLLAGGLIVGRKVGRDWLISDVDAREWLTRREGVGALWQIVTH